LLRTLAFQNESVARLAFRASLKSFRELSPRTDRMMTATAAFRFTLTAAHWVIDRVHRHSAHMRTASLPTRATSFAAGDIHVIDVSNLTDGRETIFMNPANFARGPFH